MARTKSKTPEAVEVKQTEGVLYLKATRPLTVREHEELSQKLRYEMEKTGLTIVLVPFSLDPAEGE
ncbi:hypothetical protein [Desulfosporosinus meridiei]|uniref:Uncharacterized protein n=1 Tax=Desulfosporosinus meridiei (strain ATCC BAA-275 / DSM 13257 / KCTC 12902 / NCIMB 13706 / S10) TaxID=768704 RepID=J7J4R1_DESMD|nr:hypothetical protein [Desulfosporosinus meridiei]AFQ46268.1 hypothetical protein Desmer_4462 [Desulfosporosinus meridiei DSM 13257]